MKSTMLALFALSCGGRTLPYPGDWISECGAKTEVVSYEAPPGGCILLEVPEEFERELAPLGECPDGLRCAVAMAGETWIAWASTFSPDGGIYSTDARLVADGSCPLACTEE